MNWNKKYDEFALSANLSESRTLVLRDILRKAKLNEVSEVEIDLNRTNQWIGKCRLQGKFHRKTITTAIPDLEEKTMGMVTVVKKYSPWVYRVLVRPLSFLAKLEGAKCADSPITPTVKPMFDEDRKKAIALQQQQDISNLETLFKNIGMEYTQDALLRLWRYSGKSISEIKNAVELLLFQNSTQTENKIRNPQGWLLSCLRYGWQKGINLYYQVELPVFNCVSDIEQFVTGIMPIGDSPPKTLNLN